MRAEDLPLGADLVVPREARGIAQIIWQDLVTGRARDAFARELVLDTIALGDVRESEVRAHARELGRAFGGVAARAGRLDHVLCARPIVELVAERRKIVGIAAGKGHHRALPERVGRDITALGVAHGRARIRLVAHRASVRAGEERRSHAGRRRQRAERRDRATRATCAARSTHATHAACSRAAAARAAAAGARVRARVRAARTG